MTWPDREILTMLDLVEHEGMTRSQVAEQFGVKRGSVIGVVGRVIKEANNAECACKKPENKDGGMPRGWWK